jgi:hypothetical protein
MRSWPSSVASSPAAIRPATLIDSCVLLDVITGDQQWADWLAAEIDPVERDVLAHGDLSRFGSPPRWSSGNQTLAACPASPPCLDDQPVSFAGPPGVILDGSHEVLVDGHGLLPLLIAVVSNRRRGRRGW